MHDDLEAKDTLVTAVPALYPSSLLYFISGVLEERERQTDRRNAALFVGKATVRRQSVRSDRRISHAGRCGPLHLVDHRRRRGNGLRCDSQHHGGFPEEPLMKTSLKIIVSQ